MRARCSVNPVMKASNTPGASATPRVSLVTIPSHRWQSACVWLNPPCTLGALQMNCFSCCCRVLSPRRSSRPALHVTRPASTAEDLASGAAPCARRCWYCLMMDAAWAAAEMKRTTVTEPSPGSAVIAQHHQVDKQAVRWGQSSDSEDVTHHVSYLFFSWMHPGRQLCIRPHWRFGGARWRHQKAGHRLCSADPVSGLWVFHLPQPSGQIAQHCAQTQRCRLHEGGLQRPDCSQTHHLPLRGVQRPGHGVWGRWGRWWHRVHVEWWDSLPEVQVRTFNGWRGDWAGLWWRNLLLQIKKKHLYCDLLPEIAENDWAQPQLEVCF